MNGAEAGGESQREDPRDQVGNVDEMVEYEHKDKSLEVPLTSAERLQIGQDIAHAQEVSEQAEKDKSAIDKEYKAKIEAAQADVSALSRRLRFGRKLAPVQVQIRRDYRMGHIKMVRLDTMETIEDRPMTSEERQLGMKFTDDKDKKSGSA